MLGVEEYSYDVEACDASPGGVIGSKNVGMSSKKFGENPNHQKSKVSWATTIDPGLGDPKVNPKGVADGRAG